MKLELSRNVIDKRNYLQFEFGLQGGFVGCEQILVIVGVEYRDPIDLMDRLSNMEVGSCWYQKGTNNK